MQVKNLEAQVAQQQDLQLCLESELDTAIQDRDRLAEELSAIMAAHHKGGSGRGGGLGGSLDGLTLEEGDEEDPDGDEEDEGDIGDDVEG